MYVETVPYEKKYQTVERLVVKSKSVCEKRIGRDESHLLNSANLQLLFFPINVANLKNKEMSLKNA